MRKHRSACPTMLLLVAFLMPAATTASDGDISPVSYEIDGRIANAIFVATRDFRRSQRNLDCFVVELELVNALEREPGDVETLPGDEYVLVAYLPKQPPDNEKFYAGGATPCGKAVTYLIDRTNKIAKKWYSR